MAAACSNDAPSARPFIGTWAYTEGGGRFECDDGQSGSVMIKAGARFSFLLAEDRVMYSGAHCSLEVEHGGDQLFATPGSSCTYELEDPTFGAYTTVLTFASETSWKLDNAVLRETSHEIFDITYADGDFHFVCDVTLSADAEKIAD